MRATRPAFFAPIWMIMWMIALAIPLATLAQNDSQARRTNPPRPNGGFTPTNAPGSDDRIKQIQQRLNDLSVVNPGLKEKAEFSVSGASIQEFLRGLAEAHNLNINVDPSLNVKITNNFRNERVMNVLLFLVRQYSLDIQFTGAIMSVVPYASAAAPVPYKPREINAAYNAAAGTLSFDLQNDTLLAVSKKITQISGKNLVISPSLQSKPVTAFVKDLPVASAIEKLAFANNLKYSRTSDDSWILESLAENEHLVVRGENTPKSNFFIKKTPSGDGKSGPLDVEVSEGSLPENGNSGKIVKVNAVNSPIIDVLRSVAQEAGINYFIFSDIKGSVTASLSGIDFNDFLTHLFQGTDYTFRRDKGVYIIGERGLEGLRSHKVIQLQYRSVDSVQSFIPAEMKKGVEIKEFKELNSFLLTGSTPQISEIETFVKNIDRIVPMITIEVIILDIRDTRTVTTGISAGSSDSVKSGGTLFPGLNYTFSSSSINEFLGKIGNNSIINMGKVNPNFYVSLSALEQNSNVNVRQTPKLSTLNGHLASLSIGNKRYYSTQTQNVLGSVTTQTVVTQQYTPVEANLAVDIKPVVSGDEQVTLTIDVNISDFTSNVSNQPPPTSNSKFRSIIRVRNEDMIVLGGLERSEKDDSGSGVPFLSRIPILKWIFSSRSHTKSKTVSVLFIKPTIHY